MQSFIAIDYETANADRRSACSLGISIVENGQVLKSYQSLIKPPEEFNYFDDFNVILHGIKKKDVKNAPNFLEIWDELVNANLMNSSCSRAGTATTRASILQFISISSILLKKSILG
jgi:DNA polymerase-3 subunit epsilon